MLKHRIIMALILGGLFILLLWLDTFASRGWPVGGAGGMGGVPYSTPPGLFVALGCLVIIPLGLREMRALLARENVIISMRVTVVAATLCMVWPWLEQVSESIQQRHDAPAAQAGELSPAEKQTQKQIEASPWYHVARWFRSVKPHYLVPTILALSLVAAVIQHSRNHRVDGAMANAGGTLLAIVYLGVLPGFFLPICMTHSAWMVLAIVGVVKAADVGAYFTGKAVGRHKLIPWLSPGKTVEGFVGGLALSAVVGAAIAAALKNSNWGGNGAIDQARWADVSMAVALTVGGLSGIVLGAVGQLGDLLESLLKRDAGVKDSGALPGFGGVLDVLDSPLLAAPVAYWLLKLVLRPVTL